MKACTALVIIAVLVGGSLWFLKTQGERDVREFNNTSPIQVSVSDNEPYIRNHEIPGIGLPSDYFPARVGMRWVYKIEGVSDDNRPLRHVVVDWPVGAGHIRRVETRAIIYKLRGKDEPKITEPKLILQITGTEENQGPLKYQQGYLVKIEKDDLGVYDDVIKLLWAISNYKRYEVMEVAILNPSSSYSMGGRQGPWGSLDEKDGYSLRFLLFGERPMISMGISDQKDDLLFIGFENVSGIKSLHFQRRVEENSRKSDERAKSPSEAKALSHMDSGFTEDVWYGKGIGLMKLVQKVNGVVTMTWTLEQ